MRPLCTSLALLAVLAFAPAARAADVSVTGWPACCGPGDPDRVLASAADTLTIDGDFGHPLAWRDDDFTVTTSGPRTFAFPRAGTYSFYCTIHPGSMVGRVKVGNDLHATPDFAFAPAAPTSGEAVTFTYTGTADPDGAIVSYRWDLDGNGSYERTTAAGTTSHTYAAAGTYAARVLVVDDGHESSAAATKDVVVAAPPAGTQPVPDAPGDQAPGDQAPGASGTGDPVPGGQVSPDLAAPAAARVRVAGGRLRLTLTEPARLTGTLRRGGRRVRRLGIALPAGASAVRLGRLRPGRYEARFTLTDASGNRSRAISVRFRVRSTSAAS